MEQERKWERENGEKSFFSLIGAHGGYREDFQDKQLLWEPICALAFFM